MPTATEILECRDTQGTTVTESELVQLKADIEALDTIDSSGEYRQSH